MDKAIKSIKAKEARALADGSSYMIDHIYKQIKETAKMNKTVLRWNLDDVSEEALKTVIAELRAAGFVTAVNTELQILKITW